MFTGIVEHVGRIESVETLADLTRFQIDLGPIVEGVEIGDSIAVSGACLTATAIERSRVCALKVWLEVQLYCAAAGEPPASLEAVIGAPVPTDPLTAKPFRLRVERGLLYKVPA